MEFPQNDHFLGLVFIHQKLVDANIRINPRLVNFPLENGCTYIIMSVHYNVCILYKLSSFATISANDHNYTMYVCSDKIHQLLTNYIYTLKRKIIKYL